jgi:hypothetical protein
VRRLSDRPARLVFTRAANAGLPMASASDQSGSRCSRPAAMAALTH